MSVETVERREPADDRGATGEHLDREIVSTAGQVRRAEAHNTELYFE